MWDQHRGIDSFAIDKVMNTRCAVPGYAVDAKPWALGRSNWLFARSLRTGERAAAIMSPIQSARMNGHHPYAYIKEVPTRSPMQKASEIEQLLPHQWMAG